MEKLSPSCSTDFSGFLTSLKFEKNVAKLSNYTCIVSASGDSNPIKAVVDQKGTTTLETKRKKKGK